MNQTVLAQKIILITRDVLSVGNMPDQPINLKRDTFVRGPDSVVDKATPSIDVLDRKLHGQKARVSDSEDLGKEFHKSVLRFRAENLPSRNRFYHVIQSHRTGAPGVTPKNRRER